MKCLFNKKAVIYLTAFICLFQQFTVNLFIHFLTTNINFMKLFNRLFVADTLDIVIGFAIVAVVYGVGLLLYCVNV